MVFFNYALRKLNAKIVYYGPGLCGKTTNLQWIHDHFEGGQKGKMISLSTEGDRTIFFDLLPLDIGTIRGMQVTLQLYTVPGQVHYNSTRQLVLRGADGVVFVADSQRTMRASNIESLHNLEENLKLQGVDLTEFPHALQFNKRDLRDLLTVDEMDREVNFNSAPFFEAVATEGVGVQETLEGIVKLVMRSLRERYEPAAASSQRAGAPGVAPAARPATPAGPASPAMSPPPVMPPARPAASSSVSMPPFAAVPPAEPWAPEEPSPPERPTTPPFEVGADQDYVSTGVYSDERRRRLGAPRENLTTASVEGPSARSLDDGPSSPDILGPYSVEPMTDEPTRVRSGGPDAGEPVIIGAPDIDPWAAAAPPADPEKPFAEQDTATGLPTSFTETPGPGAEGEPEFAFGVEADAAPEPENEVASEAAPPVTSVTETPSVALPDGPAPWEVDEPEEATAEPAAGRDPSAKPIGAEPKADSSPPAMAPTPPRRAAQPGSVDDLVASIFGAGRARKRPPASVAEPPAQPARPPVRTASPRPPARTASPGPPARTTPPPPRSATPVTVGQGDPFQVEEPPLVLDAPSAVAKIEGGASPGGMVRMGDNQLHLRLQGTGAIAESGQVRALDIEVPVPGSWVGNRRVTLQLRLTLSPAAEDEDGGSSGAP